MRATEIFQRPRATHYNRRVIPFFSVVATVLVIGQPIDREIAAKQTDTYELQLHAHD